MGRVKFESSNDKEINEHIIHHFEMSRKEQEDRESKKKAEQNEEDEDIYEGFDEDGNRIA